ncbi:MAG: cytochrome b5 domain-containing protein [Candidatus Pacebacteria bacterium]|nr:cytochrome b5 domain-containing protein [Candidatus Paceibacterota bacterium]
MKLKYITLLSFIIFVGGIVALAFLPPQNIDIPQSNEVVSVVTDTSNTNPNTNNPNTKTITLTKEEIAKHNNRNDCYLIIKDQVYSVASFIDSHPGGVSKLVNECGREASAVFAKIHSNFAWNLLNDYYIGKLGQTIVVKNNTNNVTTSNNTNTTNTNSNSKYEDEEEYEDD